MPWWNAWSRCNSGNSSGGGSNHWAWGKLWDCANPHYVATERNGNTLDKDQCYDCEMYYSATLAKLEVRASEKRDKAKESAKALAAGLAAPNADVAPKTRKRLPKKARKVAAAEKPVTQPPPETPQPGTPRQSAPADTPDDSMGSDKLETEVQEHFYS